MSNVQTEPKFSKVQEIFFPVRRSEIKKVLLVSFLFMCILFVYTFLRCFKYTFIQKYAVNGGAELLPGIKLFFVVPTIILVLFLFEASIDKFGRKKTFSIAISAFAFFLAIFAFILFPNRDLIHASAETIEKMRSALPNFCYYLIPCITNWSFTLFYLVTEIWGGFVIPVLFWQFANQITLQSEVKRFLGVYASIGHIGVFIAGTWIEEMSKVKDQTILSQNIMTALIASVVLCVCIIIIYKYVTKHYAKEPSIEKKVIKKKKISIFKGIKFLFTSKYILCITLILLSYYIASDLVEIVWQGFLSIHLPVTEFSKIMGIYLKYSGVAAIVFSFLANFMYQKFTWKYSALVTPTIILLIGGSFLLLHFYSNLGVKTFLGFDIVKLVVYAGLFNMIFMKGAKFAIFDTSRNMAYRPLDEETKSKGQATAEMLGSKLGKSTSSGINYILTNLVATGTKVGQHLYVLIPLVCALIVIWVKSIFTINKTYEQFDDKH